VDFYATKAPRRLVLVGLYLIPFAGIAFVWFIVALRMWISGSTRREDVLLSNIQLVSGILFVALFFAGGAAAAASAASAEFLSAPVDAVVARQLPALSNALVFVLAMRRAAMFVFATSNIGRTTGALSRWFVLLGFSVAQRDVQSSACARVPDLDPCALGTVESACSPHSEGRGVSGPAGRTGCTSPSYLPRGLRSWNVA